MKISGWHDFLEWHIISLQWLFNSIQNQKKWIKGLNLQLVNIKSISWNSLLQFKFSYEFRGRFEILSWIALFIYLLKISSLFILALMLRVIVIIVLTLPISREFRLLTGRRRWKYCILMNISFSQKSFIIILIRRSKWINLLDFLIIEKTFELGVQWNVIELVQWI